MTKMKNLNGKKGMAELQKGSADKIPDRNSITKGRWRSAYPEGKEVNSFLEGR